MLQMGDLEAQRQVGVAVLIISLSICEQTCSPESLPLVHREVLL